MHLYVVPNPQPNFDPIQLPGAKNGIYLMIQLDHPL